MASIKLENIRKEYSGKIVAVHDFSIDIEDKEFIILVGPSGCGKSTLLRMIAGLEEITSGEMYIGGTLVNNMAPRDRNIAMVFQNYALYPHMTVYKNLAFSLELQKLPKDEIEAKVISTAQILDIEHLLKRKPRALSGGQRQRVALGRAMVRNPSVFLLDEPLSNLDAKLRTVMRTELSRLHKELGSTFIYVTHDQVEAMTMGDRIVVMREGLIQQIDKPQRLYDVPANMFVAGFIGSPQMNFLKVILLKDKVGYKCKLEETLFRIPKSRIGDNDISPYIDKEIIMGIRPEDLYEACPEDKNFITCKVSVRENMGAEVYLYMDYADQRLVARLGTDTAADTDCIVRIRFDLNKLHLFDIKTEKSLLGK